MNVIRIASGATLVFSVWACGSGGADPGSGFGEGGGQGAFGGTSGTNTTGGTGSLGSGGAGSSTDLKACATSSGAAKGRPVYLVFMFDKSGSMTKNNSPKWSSCKAATTGFFESPASAGVSASLAFFPQENNNGNSICTNDVYAAPSVAMIGLPNAAFKASLDAQTPNGGTPTKPALEGALAYAAQVKQGPGSDGNVAVVLVTDGEPNDCSSTADSVSTVAQAAAATTPTYVIGVGSIANLNQIAAAGGTQSAFIVSTTDPAQIQADFSKAIAQIKASALSCDYTIPPPPNGEAFDRAKVNVVFTADGAATGTAVAYNPTCAGGGGWRYDDPNAPTKVLFCETTCGEVKATPGKVDIVFGCETRIGEVK